jgi:ribosomal protein S18 acetylase RimI-like enzyme
MAAITNAGTASAGGQHLRPINPQRDLIAIADLVELCFAGNLDREGKRYLEDMRLAARTPGYLLFASATEQWSSIPLTGYVWIEKGGIVGNLSLIPYRIHGKHHYLIANVAVHPDYRRQGIGRALTLEGIRHARDAGVPSVWLQVREDNDAAVTLYTKLGFKEQARRTTWYSSHAYSLPPFLEGIRIGDPPAGVWETQKSWLLNCYPEELRWNLPLKPDLLRPGIVGALSRLLRAMSVQQWAAWRGHELLGILSCQTSVGFSSLLWLASTQQNEDLAARVLLPHARKVFGSHRSFIIDFPAHHASAAIESAGFYVRQSLIWMKIDFTE